jgi:hypothetical protein
MTTLEMLKEAIENPGKKFQSEALGITVFYGRGGKLQSDHGEYNLTYIQAWNNQGVAWEEVREPRVMEFDFEEGRTKDAYNFEEVRNGKWRIVATEIL